jgi:hypothetical protein
VSIEAVAWVLREAPTTDAESTLILLGLANHAHHDGTAAWPGQATLARYARSSERTVRRRLVEMEAAGIVIRGDQQMVAHLPANRRPVVWDIPGVIHNQGGQADRADSVRGDRNDNQGGQDQGLGRSLVADKPSLEPSEKTSLETKIRFAPVSPLLASLRAETPLPAPTCPHGSKPWRCETCRPASNG